MEDNQDKTNKPGNKKWFSGLLDTKTKRTMLVVAFGAVLFVALSHLDVLGAVLSGLVSVLWPFLLGIVIAFLLNMPLPFLERHLFKNRRHKRGLSVACTFVLAIAVLIILLVLVIPQIFSSLASFIGNIPEYLANLEVLGTILVRDFGVSQDLLNGIYDAIMNFSASAGVWAKDTLPTLIGGIFTSIGSGIVTAVTSLVACAYFLANKEKLLRQGKRVLYALIPEEFAGKIVRVGKLSSNIFSGYIGGRLLDSLILGVITFVFMGVVNLIGRFAGIGWLQMPYALFISVLIGLTNIIPYFGPVIGTVPCFLILFMVSPISALLFVVFVIVLQQVDNNFITPKVVGKSTGLPALWVFVGTIIGGNVGGIGGMLLGVPIVAILYVIASGLVEKLLIRKGLDKKIPRLYAAVATEKPAEKTESKKSA